MSDIILPDGRQPLKDNRPSNKEVLSFIEKQVAEQQAGEMTDKIVNSHFNGLDERRKKQLEAAVRIVMTQLDGDAKMLEAVAKEPSTVLADAHDKMQMARCFRVTMGWLQGLVATQAAVDQAKDQKPENQ